MTFAVVILLLFIGKCLWDTVRAPQATADFYVNAFLTFVALVVLVLHLTSRTL
jgi:hypothetical protein